MILEDQKQFFAIISNNCIIVLMGQKCIENYKVAEQVYLCACVFLTQMLVSLNTRVNLFVDSPIQTSSVPPSLTFS